MVPVLWSVNLFVLSALICATMVFVCAAKRHEICLAAVLGVVLGVVFRIPSDFPPVQIMIWLMWWGVGGFVIHQTKFAIGKGRGFLHHRNGADERRVRAQSTDGKVLGRARGLNAAVPQSSGSPLMRR